MARRAMAALEAAVAGFGVVRHVVPRTSPEAQARAVRLGRALGVTVPVLLLLVGLLASADAVFASLLTPDLAVGPVVGHVTAGLLLAVPVLGAGRGDRGRRRRRASARRLRRHRGRDDAGPGGRRARPVRGVATRGAHRRRRPARAVGRPDPRRLRPQRVLPALLGDRPRPRLPVAGAVAGPRRRPRPSARAGPRRRGAGAGARPGGGERAPHGAVRRGVRVDDAAPLGGRGCAVDGFGPGHDRRPQRPQARRRQLARGGRGPVGGAAGRGGRRRRTPKPSSSATTWPGPRRGRSSTWTTSSSCRTTRCRRSPTGWTTAASPCGALPRHTASRPSTSRSPAPRTCAAKPAGADAGVAADRPATCTEVRSVASARAVDGDLERGAQLAHPGGGRRPATRTTRPRHAAGPPAMRTPLPRGTTPGHPNSSASTRPDRQCHITVTR